MSAHGAPVRSRQNIPFKTRRSSTRATPRTLFGSKGLITDHSKSVRSKRAIQTSIAGYLNHCSLKNGIPLWVRDLVELFDPRIAEAAIEHFRPGQIGPHHQR